MVESEGRGEHQLTGGELNDELLGHHGDDVLRGGPGRDVLWGDWDPLNNNTRQRDVLVGGDGADWLYTSHGHNTVRGDAGDDYVWAYYGTGTIDCGPGFDTLRVRLDTTYAWRNCERIKNFCAYGSKPGLQGGCYKPGEGPRSATGASSARLRATAAGRGSEARYRATLAAVPLFKRWAQDTTAARPALIKATAAARAVAAPCVDVLQTIPTNVMSRIQKPLRVQYRLMLAGVAHTVLGPGRRRFLSSVATTPLVARDRLFGQFAGQLRDAIAIYARTDNPPAGFCEDVRSWAASGWSLDQVPLRTRAASEEAARLDRVFASGRPTAGTTQRLLAVKVPPLSVYKTANWTFYALSPIVLPRTDPVARLLG